jgi:transcriptional regulator with XRE-family HTH domain
MTGKVVRTRVADANHVVHTLEVTNGRYRREPCAECPWRVENAGTFPASAFRLSACTAHDMSQHVFACHMSGMKQPATCAGFLLRGADHNLAIRLQRAHGKMLDVKRAGATLHVDYRAMAEANGVPADDPALAACRDGVHRTRTSTLRRGRQGHDPDLIKALGKVIAHQRRALGLKAYSVAQDLGTTEQAVSAWETGKSAITLPHLRALAGVLQVPAWSLLRAAERLTQVGRTMAREGAALRMRAQEAEAEAGE